MFLKLLLVKIDKATKTKIGPRFEHASMELATRRNCYFIFDKADR